MFGMADANGSGSVSVEEFLALTSEWGYPSWLMVCAFSNGDVIEKDGELSLQEFTDLLLGSEEAAFAGCAPSSYSYEFSYSYSFSYVSGEY